MIGEVGYYQFASDNVLSYGKRYYYGGVATHILGLSGAGIIEATQVNHLHFPIVHVLSLEQKKKRTKKITWRKVDALGKGQGIFITFKKNL